MLSPVYSPHRYILVASLLRIAADFTTPAHASELVPPALSQPQHKPSLRKAISDQYDPTFADHMVLGFELEVLVGMRGDFHAHAKYVAERVIEAIGGRYNPSSGLIRGTSIGNVTIKEETSTKPSAVEIVTAPLPMRQVAEFGRLLDHLGTNSKIKDAKQANSALGLHINVAIGTDRAHLQVLANLLYNYYSHREQLLSASPPHSKRKAYIGEPSLSAMEWLRTHPSFFASGMRTIDFVKALYTQFPFRHQDIYIGHALTSGGGRIEFRVPDTVLGSTQKEDANFKAGSRHLMNEVRFIAGLMYLSYQGRIDATGILFERNLPETAPWEKVAPQPLGDRWMLTFENGKHRPTVRDQEGKVFLRGHEQYEAIRTQDHVYIVGKKAGLHDLFDVDGKKIPLPFGAGRVGRIWGADGRLYVGHGNDYYEYRDLDQPEFVGPLAGAVRTLGRGYDIVPLRDQGNTVYAGSYKTQFPSGLDDYRWPQVQRGSQGFAYPYMIGVKAGRAYLLTQWWRNTRFVGLGKDEVGVSNESADDFVFNDGHIYAVRAGKYFDVDLLTLVVSTHGFDNITKIKGTGLRIGSRDGKRFLIDGTKEPIELEKVESRYGGRWHIVHRGGENAKQEKVLLLGNRVIEERLQSVHKVRNKDLLELQTAPRNKQKVVDIDSGLLKRRPTRPAAKKVGGRSR